MNKNICFLCGDLSRGGGTERITSLLSNELCKSYNIYIVDIMNKDKKCYFNFDESIKIKHIKMYEKFSIPKKILEIFKFIRKNNINIIINVDIMLIIYSFLPAKLTNTKIISWEQFNYYNNIGSRHTHNIRQFCLKFTDYYVNLTKQDVDTFKKNFKIKTPITYVYNPINKINEDNYDINSKFLITAGNFYKDKGYDMCLKIGESIFFKYPDWKWILCGDGPEFERVKKEIELSKFKDNYIFTGRVNNVECYMQKASMYVSLSRTEGFGLVLIEAQNKNLPIVAFDVPFGPREIVVQNVNGFLIPPFDTIMIANKIGELIDNLELRKNFSEKSKLKFNEFEMETIISRWKSIFKNIE